MTAPRVLVAGGCGWADRVAASARALGMATLQVRAPAGPLVSPAASEGADDEVEVTLAGGDAEVGDALLSIARHTDCGLIYAGGASGAVQAQLARGGPGAGVMVVGGVGGASGPLAGSPAAWAPAGLAVPWQGLAPALRAWAAPLSAGLPAAGSCLALPVAADAGGRWAGLAPTVGPPGAAAGGLWESPGVGRAPTAPWERLVAAVVAHVGLRGVAVLWLRAGADGPQLALAPPVWPLCRASELACGVDLVEWQLRMAAGEAVPSRLGMVPALAAAFVAQVALAAPPPASWTPPSPDVGWQLVAEPRQPAGPLTALVSAAGARRAAAASLAATVAALPHPAVGPWQAALNTALARAG